MDHLCQDLGIINLLSDNISELIRARQATGTIGYMILFIDFATFKDNKVINKITWQFAEPSTDLLI